VPAQAPGAVSGTLGAAWPCQVRPRGVSDSPCTIRMCASQISVLFACRCLPEAEGGQREGRDQAAVAFGRSEAGERIAEASESKPISFRAPQRDPGLRCACRDIGSAHGPWDRSSTAAGTHAGLQQQAEQHSSSWGANSPYHIRGPQSSCQAAEKHRSSCRESYPLGLRSWGACSCSRSPLLLRSRHHAPAAAQPAIQGPEDTVCCQQEATQTRDKAHSLNAPLPLARVH
jgi:hypothetical protein